MQGFYNLNIRMIRSISILFFYIGIFGLAYPCKIVAQENIPKDSVRIDIENAGSVINSAFPDYAPVISADGSVMFFTSRRPVTAKQTKKSKLAEEYIYSCSKNGNIWSAPQRLPHPVNKEGRFNSVIALSNDGQRMLLYRDDENGNGDIYESVLKGNEWSEPEKLSEPVNSSFHESSATYSPDAKTIFFVSERPGGYGGMDIWSATKDNKNNWKQAVNLGSDINSSQNEEGVFLHPDGTTLYFSSKKNGGYGGYDIYLTQRKNNHWLSPQNLGSTINTPGDDVYFVMEANGQRAYFSSSRQGTLGEKDIFVINYSPVSKQEKQGPKLTLFKGMIIDEKTRQPLEAIINILDNSTNENISQLTSNSVTGKYLVSLPAGKNYGINVSASGYLFHSENFNISDSATYREVDKIIEMKKIEVGQKIILKNIFFDTDKSVLRTESEGELDRLANILKNNPDLKIEISGHTDSKGNEQHNKTLSENRARAVVDYLEAAGISKDRLTYKGYGPSEPIAANDTDEGRQLNRRVQFEIIEIK